MKDALAFGILGLIILGLPIGAVWYVYTLIPSMNVIDVFMMWLGTTVMTAMITLLVVSTFFPKFVRGEFSNRNHWGV